MSRPLAELKGIASPKVSIITPTYNHEKFIGQCIESVLAQTYPNWEQIIVDDGSTDRTGEIVAQYKDERVKYIRQDNLGIWRLSKTYNKALEVSQGEFIAILEGDDFWPPYKLERQLPAFERQEVVLSWGKIAVTDSEGKTIAVLRRNLRWFQNRTKEEVLRRLLFGNFIPACTAICRKDALLSIGGFKQPEYATYVDYPTCLELCLLGQSCPVDEILGYWRRHREQVTIAMTQRLPESHRCAIDFFKHLPQELRDSLGISLNDLLDEYQHHIAVGAFSSGRIALIEDKWEEARGEFKVAMSKGPPLTKLEALLGIICAYCRVDLEWAATITRRPRLIK